MITDDNHEWVTGEEARAHVHVRLNDALLRQWKRRGLVIAQRLGKVNYYRLDTVEDAEAKPRQSSVRPADEALAETITGALQ